MKLRAVLPTLLLALLAAGCSYDSRPRDLRTVSRSAAPHDALACPSNSCAALADFESPVFAVSPAELTNIARRRLSQEPRSEVVAEAPEFNQIVLVQRTAVLRFPDTIWEQAVATPQGTSIILYSRSNAGYWDFGVNRRRVEDWLQSLVEAAAEGS